MMAVRADLRMFDKVFKSIKAILIGMDVYNTNGYTLYW